MDAESLWRGQVLHAQTGQSAYFDRIEALLAFIQRWTGDLLTLSEEDVT